ncbi:MAG: efflux RND transporter periplasmic adaptor subunit [Filomicrobium sp.]
MPKIDSNISTFLIAITIAGGMLSTMLRGPNTSDSNYAFLASANAQSGDVKIPTWAASATGRVEPSTGAVRISARAGGRIEKVLVSIGDRVSKGDVLVKLKDSEARQKVIAAEAEEQVRKLERAEEEVTGLALDRRKLEDEVADAQREVYRAWRGLDDTLQLKRDEEARDSDVLAARDAVTASEKRLAKAEADLKLLNANPDLPLPGRLDTSLTIARADLALAEEAVERTRIRAPFDGTILNVMAREGETAAPSVEAPLFVFGDLSKMNVRAEVEERDVGKVRVGQKAIVKADAYPNREFEGVVKEISGALGSPRIAVRGPRRPNDVDVLEVVVELEGTPPLLTGMRVDVFFRQEGALAVKPASVASKATH